MKKKVLILCPPPTDKGGVANYYSLVKKYFYSERISVDFYYTGKDYSKKNFLTNRWLKSLYDLVSLFKLIPHYDLIVLNPSLDTKALVRDGMYHFIAKRILQRKTLIFIRGWLCQTELIIDRFGKKLFKFFFNSNHICVLSKQFIKKLILWGFDPDKITLETTVYEEYNYNIEKDYFKMVFLSRFVEGKGCLEAIQTVEILKKEFPKVKLYMVGDGEITPKLMEYVANHNLNNHVEFTGYLTGDKKHYLLDQCGIMLYPTKYGEGMPNCIIEGIGMGLVIVTRPVAGLSDIIAERTNGFLIQSTDPQDFAQKVKLLLQKPKIWQKISYRNRRDAKKKFEIRTVVKRLEKLYYEIDR